MRTKKKTSKKLFKVFSPVLVAAIAMAPVMNTFSVFAANNGIAIPENYDTLAEAQAAAADLNIELTGEGSVLLKNENAALPLAKDAVKVTVFGSAATSLQGGSGRVNEALANDGFDINETVITETSLEDADVGEYSDVAVVVLRRGGGEGSDLSVATSELANDAEENDGWEHKRLALNNDGDEVKHNQMLTAAELEMIEFAKANCDKVIVLLNTSNAMEMYNLQYDDGVDAIMFVGRPGANGVRAIPKLLSGEVTPSGKLVAEWYRDFSADPTWYNSIANVQNDAGSNSYILADGSQASSISMHGVDYSEDIYIGYRYYETIYAEILAGNLAYVDGVLSSGAGNATQAAQWHADNVVYPFGYGLSYTSFKIGTPVLNVESLEAAAISSAMGNPADVKTVKVTVEVENTGDVKGKEVVEIYSSAPYTAGGIEKAAVNLVGFAKTKELAPGEKQTLEITVNLQDIASYDYTDANGNGFKGYELENGTYTLYASNTSHCTSETASATLEIVGDATLGLDDFSDNEIENLFSAENGYNYSIRKNNADWNGDGAIDENDVMFTQEQVLLSRADMVGTFPKAPVTTIDGVAVNTIPEFSDAVAYEAGDVVKVTIVTTGVTGSSSVNYYRFTEDHAAGAFDENQVETLPGSYVGALVVTDAFADLMDYYAQYDLNLWKPYTAYFEVDGSYSEGDLLGIEGTTLIYEATKDQAALPQLTVGSAHSAGDYIYYGNNVYRVEEEIATIEFIDNGESTDSRASQDYTVGQFVTYKSANRWTGAITINNVRITADITAGQSFSTRSNCQSFNAGMRLITEGDDANVTLMSHEDYVKLFASKTEGVNDGDYVYSDKLFAGNDGQYGYASDADLYDVTAEMMAGWSQMANTDAQTAARIAAGDDWIYFNELSGIKFNDTEIITEGQFAGMTGEQVWTKFMNQWTWNDFWTACWNGGNNGNAVPNLGTTVGGVADSPTSFNGTYTWCCNCSIASTWNVELLEEQGALTAEMGLLRNATNSTDRQQWLNPAINFHRTPFSGRNNEYYGQDGYHAGALAAACVKGIQSRGVGSHLKHMFLNDQETNRNAGDLMAWVSEQAIREIYIKAFQMAIQEGGAEGAMSAFARIGAVPTPVSHNMCNILVREEWGATNFFFHPDMYSPQANVASEDLMLRTGHNHAPGGNNTTNPGTPANNTYSGRWDANYYNELTGTMGGVIIGQENEAIGQETYYSNNQWYIVRYSAMIMYSEYANQGHSRNGITVSLWEGSEFSIDDNSAVRLDIGYAQGNEIATYVEYSIGRGELPAGLELNAETGVISGTAEETGVYEVTVNVLFDKWIQGSASVRIVVGHGTIISTEINENGELVITYSDGCVNNLGVVVGADGEDGAQGPAGEDGEDGAQGPAGPAGEDGEDGEDGANGADGKSAYEIAVENGFEGTVEEWLESLVGADGEQGEQGEQGPAGPAGPAGPQGEAGCAGSIAGTAIASLAAMAVVGGALVARKRK